MKKFIALAAVAILITACNTNPPERIRVRLDVNVTELPRPMVAGTTNLPDGTELLVSVESLTAKYSAQNKTTVTGGKFQTVNFSDLGSNLNPGRYSAEVIMPIATVQPKSVQAVIGSDGRDVAGAVGPTFVSGVRCRRESIAIVRGQEVGA